MYVNTVAALIVASFEGGCNWHADCSNVHQSCPWVECSFLYHKPSPRHFRQFDSASNWPHNCRPHVTRPVQDLHIQHVQLQLLQQSVCITKEFLHKLSETVSGMLICMLIVLIEVSTWLQFVVVTDLSGQMLIFECVWHIGEVFSSQMNPGFHCGWAVCWCQRCGLAPCCKDLYTT